MDIRKFLVLPALIGALSLAACGEEEPGADAEIGEGVEAVGEGVGEGVGEVGEGVEAVGEGVVGGTAEILGNGIDDDGDGLIDEET